MFKLIIKIFKGYKFIRRILTDRYSTIYCFILFKLNDVHFSSFVCSGIPFINKSLKARIKIGNNFKMNNGSNNSDSSMNGKCRIDVREAAILTIGNDVGMSDVTITCHKKITIGNNVLLGVGCQVRDTDNHSLNPYDRLNGLDWKNKNNLPIIIEDNVFIGANALINKGVRIEKNSIIAAGSVVVKDIPSNEIWGGNPAKLIKTINFDK